MFAQWPRLTVLSAGFAAAALTLPSAAAQRPAPRPQTPAPRPQPAQMHPEPNWVPGRNALPLMMRAGGAFGLWFPTASAGFGYGYPMAPSYGGYPMPPYGGGGPSAGGYASEGGPAQLSSYPPPEARQAEGTSELLAALGVPVKDGHLRWPGGLLALHDPEAADLCRQIDGLFEEAARQARVGPVHARLDEELSGSIGALRKLLLRDQQERSGLPYETYEQSKRFLAKLRHAESLLKDGLAPPGEAALKTSPERPANDSMKKEDR